MTPEGDGEPQDQGSEDQGSGEQGADDQGADAARAALNRARAAAAARGNAPGTGRNFHDRSVAGRRRVAGASRRSSDPDSRDPQRLLPSIERLVAERGWGTPVAVGGVMGRWDAVVGAEVAAHCVPESFEDGVLVVQADSTAWATQVRLLVPQLSRRLAEELGPGTVQKVVVRGPSGPSWRRGHRSVRGTRGPRDTYG